MVVTDDRIYTDVNSLVDHSGGCLDPVSIHIADRRITTRQVWFGPYVTMHHTSAWELEVQRVRCRKCPSCAWWISRTWTERAISEWKNSLVSVFGTLTFSEKFFREKWEQLRLDDVKALQEAGEEDLALARTFDAVPEFEERARAQELRFLGRELTLFFKRLRKGGLSPRYMVTTEFGRKKGRPHFHFVMHFKDDVPVRTLRKKIKDEWEHVGFSDVKPVVSEEACQYASKYIAKFGEVDGRVTSGGIRVRSSFGYGREPPALK